MSVHLSLCAAIATRPAGDRQELEVEVSHEALERDLSAGEIRSGGALGLHRVGVRCRGERADRTDATHSLAVLPEDAREHHFVTEAEAGSANVDLFGLL